MIELVYTIFQSSGSVDGHASANVEDVTVSAQVTFTPQFVAEWPSIFKIFGSIDNPNHVPDSVVTFSGIFN